MLLETAPRLYLATDISPKSCASPKVDIVTKSIVLRPIGAEYPPKIKLRVGEDAAPVTLLATLKSPKSTAFPVAAIVT